MVEKYNLGEIITKAIQESEKVELPSDVNIDFNTHMEYVCRWLKEGKTEVDWQDVEKAKLGNPKTIERDINKKQLLIIGGYKRDTKDIFYKFMKKESIEKIEYLFIPTLEEDTTYLYETDRLIVTAVCVTDIPNIENYIKRKSFNDLIISTPYISLDASAKIVSAVDKRAKEEDKYYTVYLGGITETGVNKIRVY